MTDPIQSYLPEGIAAPMWLDQPITLTHLATHTSGLPAWWSNLNPTDANSPFAGYTAERMYEFLASYELTRAPGATFGQRAFAGFKRDGPVLGVVLANSDFDVTDIGFHLLDTAAPLTSVRRPVNVPELILRHYVGRYESDGGDSFTIGLLRGHLTLEYEYHPDLPRTFTLPPSGANRFYLTFPEASAVFQTNSLGHATALVWAQSGATETHSKVRLPSSLALRRVDGVTQLSLSGDTDREYVVQVSADLADWVGLSTNTIWDGRIMDPESAALSHRFYRVFEP